MKFENLLLDNQLCFALYAATNAITRAYRKSLSQIGLTYPQYLVLLVLWEKEGISVKDISQALQLDSPTLTPLLKRLEKASFIKRQRNLDDERIVNIFLTKKGKQIQKKVADIQKSIACQTGLSDSEFFELRSTLEGLTDSFNTNQPDLKSVA